MVTCSVCGRTLGSQETGVRQYASGYKFSSGVLTSKSVICNDCSVRYPDSFVQKER